MSKKKIRVLIAKPGLDGHDRGAKVVARALRDSGMEIIYTGIRQTPAMIVQAALQEDVDIVGLSCLSGAHLELFHDVMAGLAEKEMDNVKVQCVGDAAVLTFNFVSYGGSDDGMRWNCTEVYRRSGTSWEIIQTHWSFTNGQQPK